MVIGFDIAIRFDMAIGFEIAIGFDIAGVDIETRKGFPKATCGFWMSAATRIY